MAKQEDSIPALMRQVPTEEDAYLFMEKMRWDNDAVCPHCASVAQHYFLKPRTATGRKTRTGAVSHRRVWKCRDCRKQFSVLTGTIFHGSKIPVRTWLMVLFAMRSSTNGVAAREIERTYDVSAKSASFMVHRIREAMRRDPLAGDRTGPSVTPGHHHRSDERVSLHGLTLEEALRALLVVDPDSEPVEDDPGDDDPAKPT